MDTQSNPILELLPSGAGERRWRLCLPLTYVGDEYKQTVSDGFRTDLASIPRGFRWITSSDAESARAAIYHDWLYWIGGVTRKEADRRFAEQLKRGGVSRHVRMLLWLGVRIGCWPAWKRYRATE